MRYIKEFIRKNPTVLVRGYVPISGVIENIKSKFNAVDISYADIPNLSMHRFNALHLPTNEILKLSEEHLQIKAIRIPITEASRHYTEKDYVPVHTSHVKEPDYIYLAYEEQVRYVYSNSNKLFLETILAIGIPEEAIENETEEYACYLFCLKCYLEYTIPEFMQLLFEE